MKNKSIVPVLVILGVILAISVGIYFMQKHQESVGFSSENMSTTEGLTEEGNESNLDSTTSTYQTDSEKFLNKIITDDFSINLPRGWEQIDAPVGITAMVVNGDEHISDPAAQKINFSSYFAVVYDTLGEKSIKEYAEMTKQTLQQSIGFVDFTLEQDLTINGQTAYQIEAAMTQQGVNFKILLVFIQGQDEDVWTISCNTTQTNWEEYKDLFHNTANSFIVKQ